jgi:tRNA(adenine34) deaminase
MWDMSLRSSLDVKVFLRERAILWYRMNRDIEFMREALEECRAAAAAGEVPIGAVLVHGGSVVARSGNRTIRDCDPTAHAEIVVLREAARARGNYRLAGTTLYVTIEPCSMCAGAMIHARIGRLVYGSDDPKGGAVRTCFHLLSDERLNHRVEVTSGVLAEDCAAAIQSFFAGRR